MSQKLENQSINQSISVNFVDEFVIFNEPKIGQSINQCKFCWLWFFESFFSCFLIEICFFSSSILWYFCIWNIFRETFTVYKMISGMRRNFRFVFLLDNRRMEAHGPWTWRHCRWLKSAAGPSTSRIPLNRGACGRKWRKHWRWKTSTRPHSRKTPWRRFSGRVRRRESRWTSDFPTRYFHFFPTTPNDFFFPFPFFLTTPNDFFFLFLFFSSFFTWKTGLGFSTIRSTEKKQPWTRRLVNGGGGVFQFGSLSVLFFSSSFSKTKGFDCGVFRYNFVARVFCFARWDPLAGYCACSFGVERAVRLTFLSISPCCTTRGVWTGEAKGPRPPGF